MTPSKLTSIGIAKVASTRAPDLDVAIAKATNHDEVPTSEKYVQENLHLIFYLRGYVNAKRLGKTRNWVMALKSVGVIHRLLRAGDPSFEQEVLYATRGSARLQNISDFGDDSHSNSWDHSAFVHRYALYLDERLDCVLVEKKQLDDMSSNRDRKGYNGYDYCIGDYGSNVYNDYGSCYNDYEGRRRDEAQPDDVRPVAIRDMKSEMVFCKIHRWQRLLERFLACRPTGMEKSNRLIQVAPHLIVKESFQLYGDICEALTVLLDRFFDREYDDCVKAFDTYSRAAKTWEFVELPNIQRCRGFLRNSLRQWRTF